MDNKQILYCILGSVILSFTSTNNLGYIPFGDFLANIVDITSGMGVILTVVFSVMLIVKNLKHQQ